MGLGGTGAAIAMFASALVGAAPSANEPSSANDDGRRTLALHVVARRGRPSNVGASELLRAVEHAITPRTRLAVRLAGELGLDPEALDACSPEVRLSCWTREARTAGSTPPAFLLVVAAHPAEEGAEELFSLLLPIEPGAQKDSAADDEATLEKLAVETPVTSVAVTRPGALDEYFVSLFERELRAPIEARRLYGPPLPRATVALPERTLPLETVPAVSGARTAVRWGGVAVAAAGVVVTVLGVAAESSANDVRSACLVRGAGASECPSLGPATFGLDAGPAPTSDPRAINPSGLPVLPLGLALLGAGGTWAASTWLLGQDDDVPWLGLALGVGLGALAFGTAVVAHGR